MKYILSFFSIIFCINVYAQKNIKVYCENVANGYKVIADNDEIFPVSVKIDFNLKNLSVSSNNNIFVIPANSQHYELTNINIETIGKKYQISLKYHSYMGNVTITNYDTSFEYELPFKTGNSFKLYQGYNGNFSHQNENALDFTMPIGTEVVAARDGIVIELVDNNNEGCANKSCMEFNNYITILHNDGTYAKYVHIDFKGAKVKLGDVVQQGQLIALSGNTGFSSGPHLHFVCILPSVENKTTLITRFKINDGLTSTFLQQGNIYTKNY